MDLLSLLKNVGGVLATITSVVYLSGYLVLRARAYALGTDPAFALAYEGYVFAGFRFMLLSLLFLLALSPAILLTRSAACNLIIRLPSQMLAPIEWLLLALWGSGTMFVMLWFLSSGGYLLSGRTGSSATLLERAVLGGEMAEVITLAALFSTALSILWLRRHLPAVDSPFTWLLGAVTALQVFLLPILHGSLYADRKVRVLAATPGAVKGVGNPLGIVDRNSDHVTLLGLDGSGGRRLVTIKLEDLNGVPVKEIVPLEQFAQGLGRATSQKGGIMPVDKPLAGDPGKSLIKEFMMKLHLALGSLGSLGESVLEDGEIWSVELDAAGNPAQPQQLSKEGGFSWPVFDPKGRGIYAIKQGRIFLVQQGEGTAVKADKQVQWLKLFGVTADGDVLGLIREEGGNDLAALHPDGTLTRIPRSGGDEEQKWEAALTGENRAYAGGRALYVDRSAKGGRGFDVYFQSGDKMMNVSNCGNNRCGQPSLSSDFSRILYVRKSAY